jgi:DNA-binding FrmR family transcriptional regulator
MIMSDTPDIIQPIVTHGADCTCGCGDRSDHNRASLNRIHRIQGQLASLERMIEADDGTCEERVVRARTVEKGMQKLITHLVECYIENTAHQEMQSDPAKVVDDLKRIINLMNR